MTRNCWTRRRYNWSSQWITLCFHINEKITAKFTADVICSVAYGLQANAIEDDNSEFLHVAHKLFATSNWKLWFITFKAIFPYFFKHYEMPFLASDVEQYFLNLTDQAINIRNQSVDKPDDYLNFLLKLKEKRNFETIDVAAHSITFFLDAYETSSIVLTHALYRLAQNTNCQMKLRQEIAECKENLSFDVLNNLKYLDQVFNGKTKLRYLVRQFQKYKIILQRHFASVHPVSQLQKCAPNNVN